MSKGFDHLVLLVDDLDKASRNFETLGFTVQERADSAHGSTAFRFVSFADGSYLLLTAFTSEEGHKAHRLGPVLDAGEGWADYSFTVDDATVSGQALAAAGFPVRGPVRVSNVLTGGEIWALDLLMAGRGADGDVSLPFVVSDIEGRQYRIPAPKPHANGATGIRKITVSSTGRDHTIAALVALGATQHDDGVLTGAGYIEVIGQDDASGHRPGGGVASIEITTAGPSAAGEGLLDISLTHGAPIILSGEAK